jgi:hypothetical protein
MNDTLTPALDMMADQGDASGSEHACLSHSAWHEEQAITGTLVEVFAVGPYKYTSLADAIAQARRDRSSI